MAEFPRPYPHPDRDTTPFWEAQNQHELTFQQCTGCRDSGRIRLQIETL